MANALVISKQTGGYFAFNLSIDGAPQDEVRSIQNDLLTVGNTLHFKTSNGANIIKQQNITPAELTIIASGTFTFATVTQVWDKLIEVGFFDWLGTGGGAGVNRFDDLLDTFQYFGKDGYVCVVNESQQKLEAVPFYNYRKFTDLEDSPSFLVPNKMVVVNPAGTSLILQDQPPTPDTYLNSVGYFDYNDSITHTTPLAFVTNTPKKLTNDTLGVNTNTSENPYGVSFVWNRTNNQFDFSQLSIGDTIDIRIQVQVTTTTANQKFKISAKFGIGSVAQFENTILSSQVKTAGLEEISFVAPFYIGSSYIRDFPAELYITSDAGGTVVVDGWYIRILRKNINILTIESSVPDATTLVKGIVRLGGDLSGTADNPTVPALATKTANTRLINTTAPLSGGGDLSVDRTISIPQADTSTNGYLAGGDWTTFNNKQGAISLTTTGSSGASTFVANALNIPNYTLAGLGGQPLNSNLTSVSSLSYVSPAFVKMTGLNTFTLDTNTYLTSTTGVTTLSGGTTGLTPNTATSGAITLAGTLVIANGGTGSTTASGARTNLGATTVGGNVFTSANPTAITFLRANADNTVSWLDATTFRTAIGAGTSSTVGTVTSVSALTLGTTGTDLSSTVATGTTTPVITLNVPTASATNRGALSSADWTTFNGKQNALTNPVTGTGAGTTNTIPKFTGVNALGNSAISDTGTIVSITNPSTTNNTLNVRNSSYDSTVATGTASLGFGFSNHIGAKIEAYKQATNITGFKFYTENGFNTPLLGLTLANGGTGTFAGNVISNAEVQAGSDTQTASGLIVNGAGSSIRTISMRTAGSRRWGWRMDDTAESGSNVGSDLRLTSYTDANAQLADVLFVKRSTGNILINTTTDDGINKLQVSGYSIATGYRIPSGLSTQYLKADGSISTLTNPITGTGTTNALPKFTGVNALGDSGIIDNGATVNFSTSNVRITGADATTRFSVGNSSSTAYIDFYGQTHATIPNDITLITNSAGRVRFFTTATERAAILANGNFLIGTTTDSGDKLRVNGTTLLGGNVNIAGIIKTSTSTGEFLRSDATVAGASQTINIYNSAGTRRMLFGYGSTSSESLFLSNDLNGDIILKTNATERINISSAGVVKVNNLSGTGTRTVVADASGNLSAIPTKNSSIITAELSITNGTTSTVVTLDTNATYLGHVTHTTDPTNFKSIIVACGQLGGTIQGAINIINNMAGASFEVNCIGQSLQITNSTGATATFRVALNKIGIN